MAVLGVITFKRQFEFVGNVVCATEFERVLDVSHRRARFRQWRAPDELGEALEGFQRILFDAGSNRLLEYCVEVNEDLGAEHAIDFVFARGIGAHQALKGRGFVRAEMVDVHRRICLPTPNHFVHQPFETDFFLLGGECPVFFVGEALCFSACDKTEQVLLSAAAYERIAFEVDEHVFGRRHRQSAKASVFCDREQFVNSLAAAHAHLPEHGLVRALARETHVIHVAAFA